MNKKYNTFDASKFELEEISVQELSGLMAAGKMTSQKITQLYLDRIKALDKNGPELNAIIELNPDALSIARQMDKERSEGKIRSPLHGIPVLIKDNIDTADKMQTTAGALVMKGNFARNDAFVVQQLRNAGCVILGKTNLSEWANFRSTNSCSGWSSRGGQTRSPYIITQNPCGSSSGSGVAVAANLCAVAVGTETDGSVVCPSAVAGIVGLKPTVGLISRSGIIPISATQDTAGPMGRTVTDVAQLLTVLTGTDDTDAASVQAAGNKAKDYTALLHKDALKGKRIGVEATPQGNNQYLHRLQEAALKQMKALGAEIVMVKYLDQFEPLGAAELTVLKCEFKDGVNKYLKQADAPVKSLTEVIRWNKENEDAAMPFFKQELLEQCDNTKGLDDPDYRSALEKSHTGSKKILQDLMKSHNLDAITGVTMGPSCAIDMIYGDRWGDVFLTQPAAISGFPHITVPAGQVYGLPVGISFFAGPFMEKEILGMAYAYEQATMHRQVPKFSTSFPKP